MNDQILVQPSPAHTIDDRRALTEDALKVAEYQLKTSIQQQIEVAQGALKQARDRSRPACLSYNDAVVRAVADVLPSLRENITFSFNVLNGLGRSGSPHAREEDIEVVIDLAGEANFFSFYTLEEVAEFRQRHGKEVSASLPYTSMPIPWGKLQERSGLDDPARDLPVVLDISIADDSDGIELTRVVDVTCSSELQTARLALTEHAEAIRQRDEELHALQTRLRDLPNLVKELDMRATVLRVRDAGGSDFLSDIIAGVETLAGGASTLPILADPALPTTPAV